MTTAKEFSDSVQHEINIDVEALLETIESRSGGDVKEFMEQHHVQVDGREYRSYTELAEAFELDIRDFTVTEVNR